MKIGAGASRIVIAAGLFFVASACSSSDPLDEVGAKTTVAEVTSSSTSAPTSTEAEETTTTVSELEIAETELSELIEAWYTFPIDTSKGAAGLPPPEYTTGLLHERERALVETSEAAGEILRSQGGQVEILDVRVDVAAGTAEADVCTANTAELLDLETGEVLARDDGVFYRGLVHAELVDDGWKVSDFFASLATDNPEPCDIDPIES